MKTLLRTLLVTALAATPALAQAGPNAPNEPVGQHYLITQDDLPAPYATESVCNSGDLKPIPGPPVLNLPEGFTVNLFATGFDHVRWPATAPNGDIFLAESCENRIVVLRDADGDGVAETEPVYWSGTNFPTGMVFRDDGLYVADTHAVWRFAYWVGDLEADRAPLRMTAADALGGSRGHLMRTLAFTPDGSDFYVAVGSLDNESVDNGPRATIQIFEEGSGAARTFASSLRNFVGLAFHPESGELYTVVTKRDDLVPNYFTRVRQDDFYGWPYDYSGTNPSPDYGDRALELVRQSLEPDVMFQSHSAPLGLVFYDGTMFPAEYQGDTLISLHGSWSRSVSAGYKIVRIRFEDGRPVGGYENFATSFWFAGEKKAELYGRPVGMTIAADSALLIADDGADVIWRIAYEGL